MMDKRLLGLVPQAMRHVIATVVWQLVGLVGNICMVYALCRMLSALASWTRPPVVVACLLLVAAMVLRTISTRQATAESFAAARDVKRVLRRKIVEKLLVLGPSYDAQVSTAEVVQLAVEGCEQLETYFAQYLPQLFYSVLAPLTLFVVLAPVSLPSALTLLVCVPLIPVVIVIVQKIAKRILGAYWDEYANLADNFLENLQGLTTLKIYQADEARHERMNEEAEHFRQVTMRVLSMQLNSIIVMDVVALGGAAAGIAVGLHALATGSVDQMGCLLIVLLSADFFIPMRQLGSYFHVAMNGMAASEKIFSLLALPEPPQGTAEATPADTVCLSHASYSFSEGTRVLDDVSLELPATGMVAVVGESGSGKSTLASLVAGILPDYEGSVRIGGSEVRDLRRSCLSELVTTVGLDSYLFGGTVRDNLLMARPGASEDEMWQALEAANLAAFLHSQQGLDTVLEQEASNLSGGQRQRLALARALMHDSSVYVFDEATSNIDIESEEALMAAVEALAAWRSVLVISHRLASVCGASRICVLEAGRVVGEGTHDELLESCPTYRTLWETQQELERYGRREAEDAEE